MSDQIEPQNKKIDVNAVKSTKAGLSGILETILLKFKTLSYTLVLFAMIFTAALAFGVALTPGIFVFNFTKDLTKDWFILAHYLSLGTALGMGFLLYGISIVFVVPFFNFLNPIKLKPYRSSWFSLESLGWATHNGLNYIVRYTFLDFITPTPLNVLYYKMMGMKVGKGVIINTTNIADPCLITIDDYVTIGGSVTMFAHYAQKGFVVVAPIHIKKKATIGLKASIMGDVIIGEGAYIAPHSAVMPKSRIPDGGSNE